ncbi:hypothetical protein [Methanosarcina sp. UBA5]|uniref:hypothetical protein n=1 Tax=Methanosarcina sp. UBA5 TaxID=1915593 RepID=UPI0025E40419|nr:hypothetical protein [Methanosarcina sp. UBA5]
MALMILGKVDEMRRTIYEMIYARFQKMGIIDESGKNLFKMVERIKKDIMIILQKPTIL